MLANPRHLALSALPWGRRVVLASVGLGLALLACGCSGWSGGDESDVEVVEDNVPTAPDPRSKHDPSIVPAAALSLNLKVGDRFPLLKTVEQDLRQPAPSGEGWVASRQRLELLLAVTVENIHAGPTEKDSRAGQKLLQVRYHRVRFDQEVAGERISYDSNSPPPVIPLEAQAYHGLKDNGFQFWLSADNQIVEMSGFNEFIEHCLRDVPASRKQQARSLLASTVGADGIANFVDDSIGLLPTEAVRPGDAWTRDRQIHQPVPMRITMQYTLRGLAPETAEIDIAGTISPSAAYLTAPTPQQAISVSVRRGRCFGSCLIDRRTGLPLTSKVEQDLDMQVQLPGGFGFEQRKTTVTTICAFTEDPASPAPIHVAPAMAGRARPSSVAPAGAAGARPGPATATAPPLESATRRE